MTAASWRLFYGDLQWRDRTHPVTIGGQGMKSMNEMALPIALSLFTHLLLPAYLIVSLLRVDKPTSQLHLGLMLLVYGSCLLCLFWLGNWSWVGYGWRYGWLGLFAIAALMALRAGAGLPLWPSLGQNLGQWTPLILLSCLLVYFGAAIAQGLSSRQFPEPALVLASPLRQGTYFVAHGGSAEITNHHAPSPAQRYALDIVKLNRWGTRASGLYPRDLSRYKIFLDRIYSPCEGQVIWVENAQADHIPGAGLPPPPQAGPAFGPQAQLAALAGNSLAIQTQTQTGPYLVVLAHLQQGSATVRVGERVHTGQPLGRVGNSGNSTEPHLHIHAVKGDTAIGFHGQADNGQADRAEQLKTLLTGEGVPLLLEGKFLVRNRLLKVS